MVTFQDNDMACGHCAGTISGDASAADLAAAIQAAPAPVTTAPRAASGCGCGCGPRKTATFDAGQAVALARSSCCG